MTGVLAALPWLSRLTGWKGLAIGAALAFSLGGWAGWEARDLFADREELRRAEAETRRLATLNAANEISHAAELADRELALVAAEAAAERERARRDELEVILGELRDAPAEDNRALSPTAQRYFDGLRGK